MKKLELYLHIPFCVRKCDYCDFLSAPAERETQKQYAEALKREIAAFPYEKEYEVCSVFFGGGTPSILPAEEIAEVMQLLWQKFCFTPDTEITLECNPGTADAEKLRIYHDCGINRLSFGLQSADPEELKLLGRIHTWDTFLDTYQTAREIGFENLNIDLMSALPGQSSDSWKRTLEKVLALAPEHISAYSLIVEEGTPFYERYAEDVRIREAGEQPNLLPSEEEERRMYQLTEELLEQAGLYRYEISNYAKTGYECRHNIGYWDGTEYAGFGLGASSMLHLPDRGWCRIRGTENLQDYIRGELSDREICVLTEEERMEEFMFLGLRMIAGVSEAAFAERFGKSLMEEYGAVVKRQQELGLLRREQGRIFLTARGLDVCNGVMAEFLHE